jgi:hypothetical protein
MCKDVRTNERTTVKVNQVTTVNLTKYIRSLGKEDLPKFSPTTTANEILESIGSVLFLHAHAGKITLPKWRQHHTRISMIRGLLDNEHLDDNLKARLYAFLVVSV